jgi:RimJ/RimL family protein N-acetyltransferase
VPWCFVSSFDIMAEMDPWFPIETERLLLRELRADDENDIHEYASDPEVVRLMIWGPSTPDLTRGFSIALSRRKRSGRAPKSFWPSN